MNVESLNCPNCGAGVESDRLQCQFCKTRLKTIGCPMCLGLMFAGSKFCGRCGAIAAPVSLDDGSIGDCPRCRAGLEKTAIGATGLAICLKCDGMWADVETFENVCADRERQSAVLGYLGERTAKIAPTKVSYVPCPSCSELMNRNNFARSSGVIVDICKQHGVWFDADELPTIIEFIRRGGMELARQREKNELIDERERLRDQRSRIDAASGQFDGNSMFAKDEGSYIRSFVHSLFK